MDSSRSNTTRRDLLKKTAVAGAITWSVPMVVSSPAFATNGKGSVEGSGSFSTSKGKSGNDKSGEDKSGEDKSGKTRLEEENIVSHTAVPGSEEEANQE